jgi:hypothetical protein
MIKSMSSDTKKGQSRASLGVNLDKNLLAYAAAASAAGVSLLALAQPAEAKIVYTKTNREIAPRKMLNLDLNHDGITDFKFTNYALSSPNYAAYKLDIAGQDGDGVQSDAAVLRTGVQVGPKRKFEEGTQAMFLFIRHCQRTTTGGTCRTQTSGAWNNITDGYLGLKFLIRGKAHYGWARFNVTFTDQGIYGLLTGYAYETVANKAIFTGKAKGDEDEVDTVGKSGPTAPSNQSPESGTLGQLARGAAVPATRK